METSELKSEVNLPHMNMHPNHTARVRERTALTTREHIPKTQMNSLRQE